MTHKTNRHILLLLPSESSSLSLTCVLINLVIRIQWHWQAWCDIRTLLIPWLNNWAQNLGLTRIKTMCEKCRLTLHWGSGWNKQVQGIIESWSLHSTVNQRIPPKIRRESTALWFDNNLDGYWPDLLSNPAGVSNRTCQGLHFKAPVKRRNWQNSSGSFDFYLSHDAEASFPAHNKKKVICPTFRLFDFLIMNKASRLHKPIVQI